MQITNNLTFKDQWGNPKRPDATKALSEAYTGANSGRLLSDLPNGNPTARSAIKSNGDTLRKRARHLERNNDIIRRAVYLTEQNVVGPAGVRLTSTVLNKGRTKEDRKAIEAVEASWVEFTRQKDIRLRYQSFRQLLKMIKRRRIIDGEAFVELVPGFKNSSNFSVRMIEPEMLPYGLMDDKQNISMGIQYDKHQVPVAYYVYDDNGKAEFELNGQKHKFRKILADKMLHYFHPERPNQGRGVTLIASPMQRLHMLDQFEEATLVGARIASSKMGFFYDDLNDVNAVGYSGADTDETEQAIDPETGRAIDEGNIINIEAGQFEDIGTKRFEAFDPGYPPAGYDEYTTSILRSISAGLNIPYHMIAFDMRDVNYSTAREARLDAVDSWKDQQQQLRDAILDPIFEAFMAIAMLSPRLASWSNDELPRLMRHRWQFRGWAWVDPQKEVQSALLQVQMGLRSPSEIVQETGRDFKSVIEQTAKDLEFARDKGVDLDTILYGGEPTEPEEEEEQL